MKNRTFSFEDQAAFAKLSGDYNPLHIDPLAARRTLFGAPVVHGIHTVLWSLDSWLADNPSNMNILSVRAIFPHPIEIGADVALSYESEEEGELRIELSTGGILSAVITLHWDKSEFKESNSAKDDFPEKKEPLNLSDEEIEDQTGTMELFLNVEAVAKMFPNLKRFVPPMQLAAILCSTRLVGVECPGVHSLYSELNLKAEKNPGLEGMTYEVTKFDKRFMLANLKITTPGMSGRIKAFVRPPQQNQASYQTLKEQVRSGEFSGQRAFIVGGSRGLGEVAAKLLAAGEAEVKITYFQGKQDANRVVDEINLNGGAASSLQFNVLVPDKDIFNVSFGSRKPTHLYYFATPSIFVGAKGIFSTEIFSKFCDYYISGFLSTFNSLKDLGLKKIYYPSTVAIDELPEDMGEYAAAKMSAEILCTFLEKTNKGVTIHRPRLPRMSTDQTVSLLPVKNKNPAPIMLEHLRNLRDASF